MKLKDIGVSVLETTSAGSVASVASSLFTPTSDGRPAVIRRTKKKQNKNPSIYEGDMEADREAGIKWVNDPDWKRLHEMNLTMVKDFLDHKENVSEQPDQQQAVAQRAAQLKTVGGGQASAGMVAKGLDKMSAGGTIPSNLVKAIAPYAQAIQKMMADPKLFARFKMLMKQANAGQAGAAVGRKLGEATVSRQQLEVFADIIGSYPGHAKIRMDFMTHAMDKLREINPQFKDSVFVARVRQATTDQQGQQPDVAEKAPPGREKQVKALKGKVDNPYAVSWASYNKSKGKK